MMDLGAVIDDLVKVLETVQRLNISSNPGGLHLDHALGARLQMGPGQSLRQSRSIRPDSLRGATLAFENMAGD